MKNVVCTLLIVAFPTIAAGCSATGAYNPYPTSTPYSDPYSNPYTNTPSTPQVVTESGFIKTPNAPVEQFNIAANTVECFGPFPRQCLVVNGELFYDYIDGYDHVEGQATTIFVKKDRVPGRDVIDASAIYRVVNGSR